MLNFSLRMPNGIGQEGHSAGEVKWFHWNPHGRISQHKGWELQLDYWGWGRLFEFNFDLTWSGTDHAGLGIELCILGFTVDFNLRDGRHWDDETNTWTVYDEAYFARHEEEQEKHRASELRRARRLVAEADATPK
jgi:hypothetical protein